MSERATACRLLPISALASCQARQFAVCSRAFMKLESLPDLTASEREQYGELALKIFLKSESARS